MSTKIDGGYAFPVVNERGTVSSGMTIRDWFAGQAIIAVTLTDTRSRLPELDYVDVAALAYALADAMLDARERL